MNVAANWVMMKITCSWVVVFGGRCDFEMGRACLSLKPFMTKATPAAWTARILWQMAFSCRLKGDISSGGLLICHGPLQYTISVRTSKL